MKSRSILAIAALAAIPALIASNADARVRIDPELFSILVDNPATGTEGFPGGPVQVYPISGFGYVFPNGVDWVDFSHDGTTLTFGEGNPTGFTLTSATPFFSVSAGTPSATLNGRETYTVTFPVNENNKSETLTLLDSATGEDITATESYSAVPEPAAWALMVGGLAGLGGVVRGRRRPPAAAS
jgi:hypothetical protein